MRTYLASVFPLFHERSSILTSILLIIRETATWRVVKKTDMRTGLQQPPVRREGEGFMHMMPLVLMSSHQILADESLV